MAPLPGVALGRRVHDALIADLRAALPHEGCGFLLASHCGHSGLDPESSAAPDERVVRWSPTRNVDASATRYTVHPEDLVRVFVDAERAGGRVLAAVHSHPRGPSLPSATDVAEGREPDLWMGIVDLSEDPPRLRLFSQGEEGFVPVVVRIDEEEEACEP